jgi:hypothetical protein
LGLTKASRYPFGNLNRIGPGFVPFYLGLVLIALSIIILLKAIIEPMQGGNTQNTLMKEKVFRVASVFFSMAAYAFFIGRLGFPITTFLFVFGLFRIAEGYKWIPSIVGALTTTICNYLVFDLWLQCQFPKGWLGI